jgi:hypothetical protein
VGFVVEKAALGAVSVVVDSVPLHPIMGLEAFQRHGVVWLKPIKDSEETAAAFLRVEK